ncbi:hypothetical protein HR13_02720 [Porphyromonas gulae]|nr:hypothetical protein HR13_02720 [Porphyromonas gulae]
MFAKKIKLLRQQNFSTSTSKRQLIDFTFEIEENEKMIFLTSHFIASIIIHRFLFPISTIVNLYD